MHGEVLVPRTGPSGYFRKLGPPSRSRWSATVAYRISTFMHGDAGADQSIGGTIREPP